MNEVLTVAAGVLVALGIVAFFALGFLVSIWQDRDFERETPEARWQIRLFGWLMMLAAVLVGGWIIWRGAVS